MAPEDQLEQDGLDPGLVHRLNLVRRGLAVGQKRFQGGRKWDEQGEDVYRYAEKGGLKLVDV